MTPVAVTGRSRHRLLVTQSHAYLVSGQIQMVVSGDENSGGGRGARWLSVPRGPCRVGNDRLPQQAAAQVKLVRDRDCRAVVQASLPQSSTSQGVTTLVGRAVTDRTTLQSRPIPAGMSGLCRGCSSQAVDSGYCPGSRGGIKGVQVRPANISISSQLTTKCGYII